MRDPDAELVRRAGLGDSSAAEALVRKHLGRIVGLARRLLGDAAEAEDVAQETFLQLWRHVGKWRDQDALISTWLHRVGLNLCYDRLRRRGRWVGEEAAMNVPSSLPHAANVILAAQRADAVNAALALLPERQRAAIALCHYEEMSNIEAAAALNVSVDALESLLARGRRALKAALSGAAPDLVGDAEPQSLEGARNGPRAI
jgi:RNA polymerase sigma-70 factor (ECF subfamily)